MPPPSPTDFGRFGTARLLEKEVRQAEKFKDAIDDAQGSLVKMYRQQAKNATEAKKAQAEVAAAIEIVSKELQGSTKNAEKYGKAVERDSKLIIEFAKKHKVSLTEAAEMYKKVRTEQGLLSEGMGAIKDRLSSFKGLAGIFAIGAAATKEYTKRIGEVREGHQLLLANIATTRDSFKDTQKYIDGYRHALRTAHEVTGKWGVSVDEARNVTRALAFSLRGVVKDASQLGKVLREDRDLIFSFSKTMNVDAASAVAFFRNEMRGMGKTHAEARKSLDMVITGFDSLKARIGAASAPLKEDYFKTLQAIRQELGPGQVSTQAMTAAMNLLGEAAKKAGLSAKQITDTMAAAPKLLKGLPKFYKMQVGGSILRAARIGSKAFKALPATIQKQLLTVQKMKGPSFLKNQLAADIASGTTLGMEGAIKTLRRVPAAMRINMLQQMGLSASQVAAVSHGLDTGTITAKKLAAMTNKVREDSKKTKTAREKTAESLKKNTTGLDKLAIRTQELAAKVKSLIDQYSQYVVPALAALTLAMNAGSLLNAIGGLGGAASGALGKLAGFAGKLGIAGVALAGLYFGLKKAAKALDKWQTKRMKQQAVEHGMKVDIGQVYKAKSYEDRIGAIQGLIGTSKTQNVLTKEGKINMAFLQRKAMRAAPGTGPEAIIKRKELMDAWVNKLKEITGQKGAFFGKGKELREAMRRRKRDIELSRENDRRKRAGRNALVLRKGETVKDAIAREQKTQKTQQVKAEVKGDKGRAKLKALAPQKRATVTTTVAPTATTGPGAPTSPTTQPGAQGPQTQPASFDPTTQSLTVNTTTTLNLTDPAQAAFFKKMVDSANAQSKRGR